MKTLKIGVVFESNLNSGGAYQQSLSVIKNMHDLFGCRVSLKQYTTIRIGAGFSSEDLEFRYVGVSFFRRFLLKMRSSVTNSRILNILKFFKRYNSFEKVFIEDGIDVVYFLTPSGLSRHLESLNYILTVWDLAHLEQLEFPEVYALREFERRQKKYLNILPKASLIVSDSIEGRINLMKYYNISEERIVVQPFNVPVQNDKHVDDLVADDVISSFDIKTNDFIFYPAQFWAHKNHRYVLEVIAYYNSLHPNEKLSVVFCGGDKGNLPFIKKKVIELGLGNYVKFLGFVSEIEISSLYKRCLALFMPTYFGPTNLPPLEAFFHKVPVIYSDLYFAEIFGDCVLKCDLSSVKSGYEKLVILTGDSGIREEMTQNGAKYLSEYQKSLRREWENYFNKIECKLATWKELN